MLPASNRLRRSADFSTVVRSGARVRRGPIVVHVHPSLPVTGQGGPTAPQFGLIVGKTVGNSVLRHRVSRRLRAQLALRTGMLPTGSMTVVRALPDAATATSAEIGSALDVALSSVLAKLRRSRS